MPSPLPQTMATLYALPDGTFSADASSGGAAVSVPVTDAVWTDDMDANGAETTSDLQCLAQDLYHVLLQSLGSNMDDEGRGVGIQGYLSSSVQDFLMAANSIDRMYELDDRVTQSQTTITLQADGSYLIVSKVLASGTVLPIQSSYSKLSGLQMLGSS